MSDDKDPKQHNATISSDEQKMDPVDDEEDLNIATDDSQSGDSEESVDEIDVSVSEQDAAEDKDADDTDEAESDNDEAESDNDEADDQTETSSDSSRVDVRRTQVLKRPKESARSTIAFTSPQLRQKKTDTDPTRDTNILSRDNPMLRRAISQHAASSGDDTNGEASLGDTREVILLIRGMVERVVMRENAYYKLGRFELAAKREDEIDLTPYGAQDRGVSRIHAQLHLDGEKLYITDLKSTNGTYLSGNRLDPDSPTLLRKGDELLLGRLAIQVLFR